MNPFERKTVKVVDNDLPSGFVIINEEDFNDEVHELFVEKPAKPAEPAKPETDPKSISEPGKPEDHIYSYQELQKMKTEELLGVAKTLGVEVAEDAGNAAINKAIREFQKPKE